MQLSAKQIKAARAMLDWSRAELSVNSGVSEPNIIRIEAGGDTRADTLRKIAGAFEGNGIVFTLNGGVEPARPELRTYQGSVGLQSFMDDVFNVVKEQGGDVVITGVVEKVFSDLLGPEFDAMHMDRMAKLRNYTMRVLIEEGDTDFVSSGYCDYRWTPKEQFSSVPFYVYGSKIAIIQFNVPVDAPLIVVLQSKPMADAFRNQFEGMWQVAKMPPKLRKK